MKWVEERDIIVMNDNCEGDREGMWTYKKGNCKSVIDYGIVNMKAWNEVKKMEVGFRVGPLPLCI